MDALFNRLPETITAASKTPWGIVTLLIIILAILAALFFYFEGVKVKATVFFIFILAIVFFSYRVIQQEDTKKVDDSQTHETMIEKTLDKPPEEIPQKIDTVHQLTQLPLSPPVPRIEEQCTANNPPLECLWSQE